MRPNEVDLRAVAAIVSPTLLGIVVVVCTLTGELVGPEVARSATVSSVALVAGTVLILGSIALFLRNPEEYQRLQLMHSEQLTALRYELEHLREKQNRLEARGNGHEGAPNE